MTKIYDQFGIPRQIEHLNAVARLENLKASSGSNPWPVIEECINVWKSTNPREYRSHLITIKEIRDTRADREFATAHRDPVHGGILRYTLDVPEKVIFMIRALYTPEELPMDRKFWLEWGKRFPGTRIAEKA